MSNNNNKNENMSSEAMVKDDSKTKSWVRGVNLGGWLVMERYITPYQFALTDCHVRGDYCWYPGQISAPSKIDPDYKLCDYSKCKPLKVENSYGKEDYFPVDERTMAEAFRKANNDSTALAEEWFNYHFENFIQYDDLKVLSESGVTHLRVPLPHWIMGDVQDDEPWLVGKRWEAFARVCKWARELNMEVWPDIHTAPGSQNGFDNSGQALPYTTCQVWSNNPANVERSLNAIRMITQAVVEAKIDDVVTGIGLLNEPYADCKKEKYYDFIDRGLDIVRETLGPNTAVYVSDMFQAPNFNDGHWWLDPARYNNTFLDSHYYQVFEATTRALSPKQHIAFTCENHRRRSQSCCYIDAPKYNTTPSTGVSRMVGEWSASFDILPAARISDIMDGIAANGTAPFFDRQLSKKREEFLRNFVEAQIVTFEAADVGTASAWFYWNFKMEGGAFAEWNYLKGVKDGWFPKLLPPTIPSENEYGTCEDILFRTSDDMDIIEQYPLPSDTPPDKSFTIIDDDVVLSHGASLFNTTDEANKQSIQGIHSAAPSKHHPNIFKVVGHHYVLFGIALVASMFIVRKVMLQLQKRRKYVPVDSVDSSTTSLTV